MLILDD